jgi:hypothetical protein
MTPTVGPAQRGVGGVRAHTPIFYPTFISAIASYPPVAGLRGVVLAPLLLGLHDHIVRSLVEAALVVSWLWSGCRGVMNCGEDADTLVCARINTSLRLSVVRSGGQLSVSAFAGNSIVQRSPLAANAISTRPANSYVKRSRITSVP